MQVATIDRQETSLRPTTWLFVRTEIHYGVWHCIGCCTLYLAENFLSQHVEQSDWQIHFIWQWGLYCSPLFESFPSEVYPGGLSKGIITRNDQDLSLHSDERWSPDIWKLERKQQDIKANRSNWRCALQQGERKECHENELGPDNRQQWQWKAVPASRIGRHSWWRCTHEVADHLRKTV